MREIICKGQRVDTEEWVEGYYCRENCEHPFSRNMVEKPYIIQKGTGIWFEVIPETVGQYTGLRDKNRKRIFEGDIIRDSHGFIWLVVFENNAFAVKNHLMELYFALWEQWEYDLESKEWDSPSDRFKVIGNIHDNPELLGGDKE